MKIYYNSKDKIYIPHEWSVEIKNNKLVYFIYGKGYVKTNMKYIQEMEVEINEPGNYVQRWKIYSKYGKQVLKKSLPNNAECWKSSIVTLTTGGEKACKLFDQFKTYFQLNISAFVDWRLAGFGLFSFDIVKFDGYISNKFGYDINKLVSLQEFIRITFGPDQVKCIENLIDFYEYIKE